MSTATIDSQKITTNLWFDTQAEEAAMFYTSIFKDGKIGAISRYGKAGFEHHGMPEGTVMVVEFSIGGQNFTALNGGPHFKFNESISFIVNCKDQNEIDYFWEKLTEGEGAYPQMCGWLKDKFGVSWQVVPVGISDVMTDPDPVKRERAMNAVLQTMGKFDIETIKRAYEGK